MLHKKTKTDTDMKIILNSLFFGMILLMSACDHKSGFNSAENDERSDKAATDKFIQEVFGKARSGDFLYFRKVYWRIENVTNGLVTMAGYNAGTNVVKSYEPRTIKLVDTMRLEIKVDNVRGMQRETAHEWWIIAPSDEGYTGLLTQWTNR